jgi:hypothetical protein
MKKVYLMFCSLSLLVGAGLGHLNGQYSAAARFAKDCSTLSIVAFEDTGSEQPRHFHCFELKLANPEQAPAQQAPARALII